MTPPHQSHIIVRQVADAVTNVAATMKQPASASSSSIVTTITDEGGDNRMAVVNKQFNSPLALYSKENVQMAIRDQTAGLAPSASSSSSAAAP